jgi:hypothetical protein
VGGGRKAGAQRSSFASAKIGLPPGSGHRFPHCAEPAGLDVAPRPFRDHERMEAIVVGQMTSMNGNGRQRSNFAAILAA